MISRSRPTFWRPYEGLDARTKAAARAACRKFAQDPGHPSLRFRKLAGYGHIWSVRIHEQYRAAAERRGDTVIRFGIGTHNDFARQFG